MLCPVICSMCGAFLGMKECAPVSGIPSDKLVSHGLCKGCVPIMRRAMGLLPAPFDGRAQRNEKGI